MNIGKIDQQREKWEGRYRTSSETPREPSSFLLRAYAEFIAPSFPRPGTALDLAGGAGRHAIWLAARGWRVTLIDFAENALAAAKRRAGEYGGSIDFQRADLTSFRVASRRWNLVLVFFYLDRQLFRELERAVAPGGLLIYKTYLHSEHPSAKGPRNPEHLLLTGELRSAFPSLEVLSYNETEEPRPTAELVARKAAPDNR